MKKLPGLFTEQAALQDRIAAALPHMSKKHKQIASFILDNRDFVAYASASQVAGRAETSAATVVRFCQSLGYDGYLHLQEAIRGRVPVRQTPAQRIKGQLTSPVPQEDLLMRVFATDVHNIEQTAALVSNGRLQTAVAEIRRARRILVIGDGMAGAVAHFFAHALQVIGLPAQRITCGGEPLALALASVQSQDVVMGIGFWRNLRDVVTAIRQARQAGASTIGITDSYLSPLARLPDHPFLVVTTGMAHSLSLVGVVSLLNAFLVVLSFSIPDQVVESLQRLDAAYERCNLLAE
ncbi:MAG: MurR/RpiR family transcriptional regulator [Chloroflexota bacterium]